MKQIAMRGRWFVCSVCILSGCLAGAADLKMQLEPAFVGYGQTTGVFPLAVTLVNNGPDAKGSLRVTSGDFQMDYPIELPRGSVKRLVTYPQTGYGEEAVFDLSTNRGSLHMPYRQFSGADPGAQSVLMIGDTQGDLGFLRPAQSESGQNRTWDCYVKPELAPDRATAYTNMAAVILAGGSERLPDAAVRALHTYLLSGGTVAFFGGASSPVLSDARWADVAPVQPKLPKTVTASTLIANLSKKTPLGSPFTIIDCVPSRETIVRREGDHVVLARRDIGLGKTVFLAFNPLEPPFTRWPERRQLFDLVLKPMDFARAAGYIRGFTTGSGAGEDSYNPYGGGVMISGSTRSVYNPSTRTWEPVAKSDPFSTELPPPAKVFWILATYFVIIIPVNFLLLKKLKRGELAWFTAPLISVGFAGAFFAAAKDLYSASLSRATQGLIIAAGDRSDALFVGKSQLFFPKGGQYDLGMEGVESVGDASPFDPYGYRFGGPVERQSDLNPVDVGHVLISRMDVNNLAFREIAFRQIMPPGNWLKVVLSDSDSGRKLTVTNASPYTLKGVAALVAGEAFTLGSRLSPGQTIAIRLPARVSPEAIRNSSDDMYANRYGGPSNAQYSGLAEVTVRTKEIVIKAVMEEVPVGPRLGKPVDERQSINFAYFTGLHYGRVDL